MPDGGTLYFLVRNEGLVMVLINQLINGLNSSAILLLTSLGIVVIMGNMGIVNMAHGECIMIGAYVCYFMTTVLGLPFLLAIPISFVILALLGILVNNFMIRKLMGKNGGKTVETLLATYGLSLILKQGTKLIFGANLQYVEVPLQGTLKMGTVMIPYYYLVVITVSVLVLLLTYFLFFKTSFGRQMRATTGNRMMTECLGIDTSKVDNITFAYGFGLAGIAGVMIAPILGVTPFLGEKYLTNAFMNVIVGGLNSLVGTGLSSVLISESITTISSFSDEVSAKLLVFLAVIVLIRIKPQGLFTKERR